MKCHGQLRMRRGFLSRRWGIMMRWKGMRNRWKRMTRGRRCSTYQYSRKIDSWSTTPVHHRVLSVGTNRLMSKRQSLRKRSGNSLSKVHLKSRVEPPVQVPCLKTILTYPKQAYKEETNLNPTIKYKVSSHPVTFPDKK